MKKELISVAQHSSSLQSRKGKREKYIVVMHKRSCKRVSDRQSTDKWERY